MGVSVSVLSDRTIRRLAENKRYPLIMPYDPEMVQPASIDLRLGRSFRVFTNHEIDVIDCRDLKRDMSKEIIKSNGSPFVIHPGEFCLACCAESVNIPDNVVARIEGKSSLGRLGLVVHATAGFIDPGFRGEITLELSNLMRVPIKIYPGMRIAQMSFMTLDQPAERPYGSPELGSHYQMQKGATESRFEYQE